MKLSRLEAGTRLVLDYLEAFNRLDLAKMLDCISTDCILETATPAPHGTTYQGKEVITRYWQDFFAQKDKLHLEIEQVFGMGIRCVACWRLEWWDARGKPQTLRGVEIFRIRAGLICAQNSYCKATLEG